MRIIGSGNIVSLFCFWSDFGLLLMAMIGDRKLQERHACITYNTVSRPPQIAASCRLSGLHIVQKVENTLEMAAFLENHFVEAWL